MIRLDNAPLSYRILLPVLLVYGLVSAIGLHYHELFLDEAHHFLLARDSSNLYDLYQNARYDGHPRLWHALLFFITHYITGSPYGMQVFHWLITLGVAFVFLRYAPFSLGVKLLILSGYYFLFEYNLLSRNYALGLLFLFCCCVLLGRTGGSFKGGSSRPLAGIGVLLFFMCNTHVFYTFAAMGIFLVLLIEGFRGKKLFTKSFLLLAGLFLAGFVCALIQARTPVADNVNMGPVNARGFLSVNGLSFASFGLVRGWLPVPRRFDGHFWNSYWLYSSPAGTVIRAILFVVFLALPFGVLKKDWKAVVFYYTGVLLLLLFFSVTMMMASRYFGMVFIFFLVALWMAGPAASRALWFRGSMYLVLLVQSVVGVFALVQDIRLPFSESKHTVDYLKAEGLTGQPIVVDGYNIGPMLCAYLEGNVFYLATGKEGSFCMWKKSYFPLPRPSIAQEVAACPGLPEEFVLVSNRDPEKLQAGGDVEGKHFRLTLLKSFTNSMIQENFFIYRFQLLH